MAEESLSETSITRNLKTRFVGQRVIYYPRVASTMELAKLEAKKGVTEGTVIVAGEQTAGRGRMKRIWLSPKGSVALSIILHPSISHLPSLIMIASLAVVRSIERVTGLKAEIKWPNDVLIGGKKVCGILIESAVRQKALDYTILGIGININLKTSDFPHLKLVATSLSDELGKNVSRLNLIRQLLLEVERLYLALPAGLIFDEWRSRLVTLGREVEVSSGEDKYRGIAESVESDGSLYLRQADGSLVKIVAGDATLLK